MGPQSIDDHKRKRILTLSDLNEWWHPEYRVRAHGLASPIKVPISEDEIRAISNANPGQEWDSCVRINEAFDRVRRVFEAATAVGWMELPENTVEEFHNYAAEKLIFSSDNLDRDLTTIDQISWMIYSAVLSRTNIPSFNDLTKEPEHILSEFEMGALEENARIIRLGNEHSKYLANAQIKPINHPLFRQEVALIHAQSEETSIYDCPGALLFYWYATHNELFYYPEYEIKLIKQACLEEKLTLEEEQNIVVLGASSLVGDKNSVGEMLKKSRKAHLYLVDLSDEMTDELVIENNVKELSDTYDVEIEYTILKENFLTLDFEKSIPTHKLYPTTVCILKNTVSAKLRPKLTNVVYHQLKTGDHIVAGVSLTMDNTLYNHRANTAFENLSLMTRGYPIWLLSRLSNCYAPKKDLTYSALDGYQEVKLATIFSVLRDDKFENDVYMDCLWASRDVLPGLEVEKLVHQEKLLLDGFEPEDAREVDMYALVIATKD